MGQPWLMNEKKIIAVLVKAIQQQQNK